MTQRLGSLRQAVITAALDTDLYVGSVIDGRRWQVYRGSKVLETRRRAMDSENSVYRRKPEEVVAVLTKQGSVVSSSGPPRVTRSRPCAIDSRGVTLYRWPLRSIFIPLERVDRFDVVLREPPLDWGDPNANDGVERLALLTHDGETLLVSGLLNALLSRWHGLPLRARAQQLNSHIPPA